MLIWAKVRLVPGYHSKWVVGRGVVIGEDDELYVFPSVWFPAGYLAPAWEWYELGAEELVEEDNNGDSDLFL